MGANMARCVVRHSHEAIVDDRFLEHSGEGRRAEQEAIEEAVAVDVLSAAVFAWFRSRRFAQKTLSAMRKGFARPKALQP
jgi:6-phosphogluconate dehydrogenase (decarboxylating)